MTVIRKISKAIGAAAGAGAAAAGIVIAELPWPAIIGAAMVAFVSAFLAPANETAQAE